MQPELTLLAIMNRNDHNNRSGATETYPPPDTGSGLTPASPYPPSRHRQPTTVTYGDLGAAVPVTRPAGRRRTPCRTVLLRGRAHPPLVRHYVAQGAAGPLPARQLLPHGITVGDGYGWLGMPAVIRI
jgi:hypothetical protein